MSRTGLQVHLRDAVGGDGVGQKLGGYLTYFLYWLTDVGRGRVKQLAGFGFVEACTFGTLGIGSWKKNIFCLFL
ncbi:hypothetical protein [Rudanella paleaurantiibacter]|uniref:hypothetical protein n=1 Tax=Rudanella paleaurantiibacter TaxID=2614655 RepID=UPI0016272C07|nr:hypothetical protein [Rudanella paleaurantiibacter]